MRTETQPTEKLFDKRLNRVTKLSLLQIKIVSTENFFSVALYTMKIVDLDSTSTRTNADLI